MSTGPTWLDETDRTVDRCLACLPPTVKAAKGARKAVSGRADLLRQFIRLEGPVIESVFGASSWTLRWLLPASEVIALPSGGRSVFSLEAHLPPGTTTTAKKSAVSLPTGGSARVSRRKREKGKARLSLGDAADLNRLELRSSWSRFVERDWRELARKVNRGGSARIEWFLALEGRLNSLWTCGESRTAASLSPLKGNLLRQTEERRKVEIVSAGDRTDGRLRRPHLSHRGRLCPYHTPESQRIGLQLFLAADARLEKRRILAGRSQLSLAVGLVPHSRHSDGPRLLMGGKNLKQAESGIVGEPARIPGDLEGRNLPIRSIADLPHKEGRFFPYLGVNALVAVMPWEGLTFEDGLVLSRTFAERLLIPLSEMEQEEIICRDEGPQAAIDEKTLRQETEAFLGRTYHFDDLLPLPQTLLALGLRPRPYSQNAPASLESVTLRLTQGRPRGKGEKRRQPIEIRLLYRFRLRRPLAIGDKITGRHGNKGVVTAILDTPPKARIGNTWHDIDLIISPCSIIGRKNFGQIAEMVQSLFADERAPETDRHWRRRLPSLGDLGADEGGRFEIDCGDGRKGRAFCGYQYICRLHHHSTQKLQAQGPEGPSNDLLGEPRTAGARSGQKLGEMENWALLSHDGDIDALAFLSALRRDQSPSGRTWQVFRTLLRALGLDLSAAGEGLETKPAEGKALSLQEGFRNKLPEAERASASGRPLPFGDTLYVITDTPSESYWTPLASALADLAGKGRRPLPPKRRLLFLADLFEKSAASLPARPEHPLATALRKLAETLPRKRRTGAPLDFDGLLLFLAWSRNATGVTFGIPFMPALLTLDDDTTPFRRILKALLPFTSPDGKEPKEIAPLLKALADYRRLLLESLNGKRGLLRNHLLGRRYARTGRAVIVPRPNLGPDETLLPSAMIARMLEGHRSADAPGRFAGFDESDWLALRRGERDEKRLRRLNQALEEHPLWVLLIRQPSLHRHNVQAFRAYAHDESVIGFPPLATPGYNADFDGDTMAVVVPPQEYEELSSWSLTAHPGFLGTGSIAFSAENDLALGWHALTRERRQHWLARADLAERTQTVPLGDLISGLCRKRGAEGLAETLKELQVELATASTASCSLGPLELEDLWNDRDLKDLRSEVRAIKPPASGQKTEGTLSAHQARWNALKKAMERTVRAHLEKKGDGDLVRLIVGRAKGKHSDLVAATGCLGFQEEAARIEDDERRGHLERDWISGCLWEGLDEDALFLYSYESRKAMASKKLLVAQGGYLSRRLAEGLYDSRIEDEDCGSEEGLTLSYDREGGTLNLSFGGDPIPFCVGDDEKNLRRNLERIAWGRWSLSLGRLLDRDDLQALSSYWREGLPPRREDLASLLAREDSLTLRSPLTCRTAKRGFCRRCMGADVALEPFDRPVLRKTGSPVGLDAAMAIGERGTQLAMKAFHDVGSGRSSVSRLENLLLSKRDKGPLHDELRRLIELLEEAGDDLPQALVHFETAMRAPQGLIAWANERLNRWIAAMSYERPGEKLLPFERDSGKNLKSAVLLASIPPEERGEPS